MKSNIEEIKLLIPDYILGKLSSDESEVVRNAIDNSVELKELYSEMRDGLSFTSSVKLEKPPPQYWATLLPRIHGRIEIQEAKGFSLEKVSRYWKVLVPAAALILIAIFYFTVINKPDESEMTKVNTEETDKDRTKDIVKPNEPVKETGPVKDKSAADEKAFKRKGGIKLPVAKDDEIHIKQEKEEQIEFPVQNNELADVNVEDESVFTGEAAGFDEEIENNLNLLTEDEQNSLIKELDKSNL